MKEAIRERSSGRCFGCHRRIAICEVAQTAEVLLCSWRCANLEVAFDISRCCTILGSNTSRAGTWLAHVMSAQKKHCKFCAANRFAWSVSSGLLPIHTGERGRGRVLSWLCAHFV